MTERFKLGIDVGGTFTDLFLWSSSGEVATFKVLSTPHDPSVGVVDGLQRIAAGKKLEVEHLGPLIDAIVHGTTVTTNAVLTRGGASVGLLTTEGVRDALEMRRGIREEQYDNRYRNVVPLVPRYLRRPVRGRLDYRGVEIEPLDAEGVFRACGTMREEGVESVAICFMNAFANPAHERAAAEIVRSEMPGAYLSVSSEVVPTIRFYNRVSTTVLNAYVGPVLRDYLKSLEARLARVGFEGALLIMQSSGGVGLPESMVERPAATLLSGPAAGPRAAVSFSEEHDRPSCLVVDMGGTSFDASLVRDGRVALRAEGDIDRLRIALPMLEIVTIGAGGGSVGWIDAGGLLRMGPESAGADPGPACYDLGGVRPTCTDADLLLGYLDPDNFAGGKMKLRPELARRAIAEHVGRPLGLGEEQAAAGMYRVINSNMAHGVREITIKRGLDPRDFPMVMAGGAGALHACMIADELDIPAVVVPGPASVLCAVGMLMSDLQHDYVRSYVTRISTLDPEALRTLVSEMVSAGEEQLAREGVPEERREHLAALDLRYLKQYHEVTVWVTREAIEAGDLEALTAPFHAEHNRLYGYDLAAEGTGLELINVRVRSLGRTEKPALPRLARGDPDPGPAFRGRRRAFVPDRDEFDEVPVYDGHALRAGNEVSGPALLERTDTTIFVSAAYAARIDDRGSALLQRNGGAGGSATRAERTAVGTARSDR
jgi:N-methylhydantoinase A